MFDLVLVSTALPETNMTPENRRKPRKAIFQPSIFRGDDVSFREGNWRLAVWVNQLL